MFQKAGVGTHELFTQSELLGGLRSGSHLESEMERTSKGCWRCEQMDCGRAGWTDDLHFSPFATQRREIGRVRIGSDGNAGIREWETQTTFDPVWRLQCEPRLLPCGRVDPTTENIVGHERFTARELCTLWWQSWTDFNMTSRKLEMKHVQVLDSDWFKTDHRAVLAVLSLTDWGNWNVMAPLLLEKKLETKEMSVTELELKSLLLRQKRVGRQLGRTGFAGKSGGKDGR